MNKNLRMALATIVGGIVFISAWAGVCYRMPRDPENLTRTYMVEYSIFFPPGASFQENFKQDITPIFTSMQDYEKMSLLNESRNFIVASDVLVEKERQGEQAVRLDYYSVIVNGACSKKVFFSTQIIPMPKGEELYWGGFYPNRKYRLDSKGGKIQFTMEYCQGNSDNFNGYMLAAFFGFLVIAILIGFLSWKIIGKIGKKN